MILIGKTVIQRALLIICSSVSLTFSLKAQNNIVNENFIVAKQQVEGMLQSCKDPKKIPRSLNPDGSLNLVNIYDWTSGFFAGNLWYLYEYTKDEMLKQEAITWTAALEPIKKFTRNHDVGFMMYCSYGNAYRLTGKEEYKEILIETAKSLSTRFNPKVGSIKSWNKNMSWDGKTPWYYPVIMDNMMNLELLFFASKVTGDDSYRNIAVKHAETTMKNHLRSDYSSYHVVNYDSVSGQPVNKETHQGYANNSTWARGQGWGIYGFTMVYRETKDRRFLTTAQKMADYFIYNKTTPADKIPFWDFNINQTGYVPLFKYDSSNTSLYHRDASASAIVASALLELSTYSGKRAKEYRRVAIQIIRSLSSDLYRAKPGTNGHFILKQSVGNFPAGSEINVPLVYADYYFLEALLRYQQLNKTGRLF
jgi:unsaturated chondroitin disaccharide hydrolase